MKTTQQETLRILKETAHTITVMAFNVNNNGTITRNSTYSGLDMVQAFKHCALKSAGGKMVLVMSREADGYCMGWEIENGMQRISYEIASEFCEQYHLKY